MGEPRTRTTLPPVRPTPHQLRVLAALVRHGTRRAAGESLGMSEIAVREMSQTIHDRLGVHTTAQAAWALRRLLEPLLA